MNIINKLTLRQLQKNKRRTTVTVFGVVISVAMIMAVMTIGISFLDMFKRATINQNGAWEAQYNNVQLDKLSVFENESRIKDIALVDKQGVALISDIGLSDKLNKGYLEVFALDNKAIEMYSVQLLDGRMPQTSEEILIPEKLMLKPNEGRLKIGDQISLSLGQRQAYLEDETPVDDIELTHEVDNVSKFTHDGTYEKLINTQEATYTIVGVMKDTVWEVSWGGSHIAVTAMDQKLLADNKSIEMVGTTYNNKSRTMFDKMEELSKQSGATYKIHHELLRYNLLTSVDSLQITLYGLTGIIMFIVIVGSVSLIYNAFGISVSDRSKYLGMLASVGATKRQKRNSVFFEAGVISLISIPIGLIAGYVGLFVTFKVINNVLEKQEILNIQTSLEVVMTPSTILLAILVSLFTIFISAWLPARRASKITAIDAIRMSYDVKITKRQVKNNRLVRKLFGLEADIALKNLKRNKRRYQVTVFSLIVSIVLFISASYFTDLLKTSNEIASDEINYQLSVNMYYEKDVNFNRDVLIDHEAVDDYAFTSYENVDVNLPSTYFSDSLQQHFDKGIMMLNDDGTFQYQVFVYSLDDKSFDEYVKEQQLTSTNWYDDNHLNAILINRAIFNSQLEQKKIEDVTLKQAQGLKLETYYNTFDIAGLPTTINLAPVTIDAVVQEPPKWLSTSPHMSSIFIVMPESQQQKFIALIDEKYVDTTLLIESDEPSEVAQYLQEQHYDDVKLSVWNIEDYADQIKGIILILNIFAYGFIALITFISLANIMNTISTGLQLRKREFAMLRSMGMTEKGFYRMINYESIFYGIKSLSYGIPISGILVYLMYYSMSQSVQFKFQVPWLYLGIAVVGIFAIVTVVMYYAGSKIKKGSIVEAIKQENL